MPVPSIIHAASRMRKLLSLLLLAFVTRSSFAKGPEPSSRIPLEPLGFQSIPTQFLLTGSSMFSIDFVDNQHLLLTYSTKQLLKRLTDCPPGDQDRVIEAVLLELPQGRVLARTSWRTHDRGQYLWNLGDGRFILRIRDTMTTLAPMVNLAKGNAFAQREFINTERRIGGVLLSPDGNLMVLETMEPVQFSTDSLQPAVSSDEQRARLEMPIQINFFRLTKLPGDELSLREGAAFRARVPGRIPANAAGYLSILDRGQQKWLFDFHTYSGKVTTLSTFNSTCRPTPIFVSRAEFIAFGCGLNHSPQVIGGFNMRGEEMWQQTLPETYIAPTFAYAPRSGRFAMSRLLTHSGMVQASDILMPELVAGQSIVVYQTDSGRQLLRVDASPVSRAGQNFALSPDGMTLAVIRGDVIEIHALPPLSSTDRDAVKMAEASAPKEDGATPGLFDSPVPAEHSRRASAPATAPPASPTPQADPAPASTSQSAPDTTVQPTENQPTGRKPPTLYTPGEEAKPAPSKQ